MSKRPPRLLIPRDEAMPDADGLALLRSHFDVVTGDAARSLLGNNGPSDEAILLPDPTVQWNDQELAELHAASQAMLALTPESIEKTNSVERLKWLEGVVTSVIRDRLGWQHFEVRLINRKTAQLELVIAVGLRPLPVGESIFAKPEGNGICGYVAATGRPYLCPDVRSDPRYRLGLENAGSSLTVPLLMGGEVVGVLNVEDARPAAFTERDVVRAQVVANSIALALHLLNLLVVERFTTRKSTCDTLSSEMRAPLDEITQAVLAFRTSHELDGAARETLDRIVASVERARGAIDLCSAGPKSLLGLERTLKECRTNPQLEGKKVLVVDDDASIRDTVTSVLTRVGCDVVACASGRDALASMDSISSGSGHLDLVISDVKLPDLNGYEVFRSARDRYASVPIILMTGFGYDPHHSIVRASQEGLSSILFKPFRADQLVEEVTRALGGDAPAR